jgi:hypothetical protein
MRSTSSSFDRRGDGVNVTGDHELLEHLLDVVPQPLPAA